MTFVIVFKLPCERSVTRDGQNLSSCMTNRLNGSTPAALDPEIMFEKVNAETNCPRDSSATALTEILFQGSE